MDLSLITEGQAFRLQPESVHGMLWLQTHFEESHWELLAEGLATVSKSNADELIEDASDAGLNLSPISALSSQLNSLHTQRTITQQLHEKGRGHHPSLQA